MIRPSLIHNKDKYYQEFADAVFSQYKQLRYGIETCQKQKDITMSTLCKQIIDWWDQPKVEVPCLAPTILQHPTSSEGVTGMALTLSVLVYNTNPSLVYQWYKNGVLLPDSNAASYVIPSYDNSYAGEYQVKVTNACGSVLSSTATIGVGCDLPTISSQPTSATNVNLGSSVTLSVTSPTPSVTYQWRKNGVAISGATSSSYTISNIISNSAGSYTCAITNSCGTIVSNTASITIASCALPTITSQPSTQKVTVGANVTLSVTASTPSGTLTYQWKRNGSVISGATNSTYTMNNIQQSSAGTYTVDVTNSTCGTVTSNSASVVVNTPVSYDTVMVFNVTNTPTTAVGVTAQAPATNANLKFEFNAGTPTGLPSTMNIYVGSADPGNFRMTVNYRPETYNGTQFRFTDTNGTQYTGTFSTANKILS